MARRRKTCYSGIGGQAVLEGVMMKNNDKYAVAVRKPNGEIEVDIQNYQGVLHGKRFKEFPFIRGIFNFVDSLMLGMKSLNFSASFYEEDEEESGIDKALNKITKGKAEELLTTIVTIFSMVLAVGIFIVLPYFISSYFTEDVQNKSLIAIIEGAVRIAIFVLYVWGISFMKDIRRLYRYHGAEHKCINCLERGFALDVNTVKRCSRLHKRCGTSFMFFVLFVSIILFFFIQVENPVYKVLLRIAMMPIVAGISYEIIRLAGRSNNPIVWLLSLPGMLIQRMTTKEPDKEMIEVAIAAIEAVFDWRAFLQENFGYEFEEADTEEEAADEVDYEEVTADEEE
ncbi:MAG: DUF1385 domain-containing protein [Lachnospiraceae bacterium]|nr:DUF1385 domain-containing protein [Lachnospiraceae bacterium]